MAQSILAQQITSNSNNTSTVYGSSIGIANPPEHILAQSILAQQITSDSNNTSTVYGSSIGASQRKVAWALLPEHALSTGTSKIANPPEHILAQSILAQQITSDSNNTSTVYGSSIGASQRKVAWALLPEHALKPGMSKIADPAQSILAQHLTSNSNNESTAQQDSLKPAPVWELVKVDCKQASLRGLHVLDSKHIFTSGSQGMVVHSVDGGTSWNVQSVAGAEELDFRDIHAIDANNVLIVSAGTPARIYRSDDGCKTWTKVLERADPKFFFDAIDFWDSKVGIVMGDPIEGKLCLFKTIDGGRTWRQLDSAPKTKPGEAGFAASGTNTICVGKNRLLVALGGAVENTSSVSSRVLLSEDQGATWTAAEVPIKRTPSAGIFSLHFASEQDVIAVGGDYKNPDAVDGTIARSTDGGKTWSIIKSGQGLTGFRSCISTTGDRGQLIAVGPNGTDRSVDAGKSWKRLSDEGFHAIDFSVDANAGWATGTLGRIGKWTGRGDGTPSKP